ncbi:MAG: hypothetical protein P9M15_00250 [Candidatus Electryoneaceae bacterium]|nr:hypothetical protein [Candidatus Electryoneaceae bacterium]
MHNIVILAEARIQRCYVIYMLDSRLRGDDKSLIIQRSQSRLTANGKIIYLLRDLRALRGEIIIGEILHTF